MKKLTEKFILTEDDKEEVIPPVALDQEPIVLSPEVKPEVKKEEPKQEPKHVEVKDLPLPKKDEKIIMDNAFVSMINGAITREWDGIDSLNSVISTFVIEKKDDVGATDIIKQIIEEKTAHIGMLQKVLGLIDGKIPSLVKDGEKKAADIVSKVEPEEGETAEHEASETPEEEAAEHGKKEESFKKKFKKRLKESLDDNYWRNFARNEVLYYAKSFGDGEYEIINDLDEEELIKISNFVADAILNTDHIWEGINEVVRDTIDYYIKKYIESTDILTAEIKPDKKESLKRHGKKKLKEAYYDPYWIEYVKDEIDSRLSSYDEETEEISILKELDDAEITEIAKQVARYIQNNDYIWEAVSEVTSDGIHDVIYDKYINTKALKAEINPEDDKK